DLTYYFFPGIAKPVQTGLIYIDYGSLFVERVVTAGSVIVQVIDSLGGSLEIGYVVKNVHRSRHFAGGIEHRCRLDPNPHTSVRQALADNQAFLLYWHFLPH